MRTLVIAEMRRDMPLGSRQEGIGLHELILCPIDIDLKDVAINWHKTAIDFADLDLLLSCFLTDSIDFLVLSYGLGYINAKYAV